MNDKIQFTCPHCSHQMQIHEAIRIWMCPMCGKASAVTAEEVAPEDNRVEELVVKTSEGTANDAMSPANPKSGPGFPDQSPATDSHGSHDRPEEGTRFKIPERFIRNFITSNEVVLTAGYYQRDIQFWGIWFDWVRSYLIATDKRIVTVRKSLWWFAKIDGVVNYADLDGIHVSHSKKKGMHFSSKTQHTRIHFQFSNGNSVETKTLNHVLVQSLCASLKDRVKLTTEQL
jgi:hypothetical protein